MPTSLSGPVAPDLLRRIMFLIHPVFYEGDELMAILLEHVTDNRVALRLEGYAESKPQSWAVSPTVARDLLVGICLHNLRLLTGKQRSPSEQHVQRRGELSPMCHGKFRM